MDREYIARYRFLMNSPATPQSILKEIARIQHMERGKLCLLREGPNGAYYNHQTWQGGKNVCRYVPQEQLPDLKEAIEGYGKFQHLTETYSELIIQKTRAELASGLKKSPHPSSS
jgi:hypothetical protein